MTYLFAIIICVVFIELFLLLKPQNQIKQIIAKTNEARNIIMSADFSEEDKESYIKKISVKVLKMTFQLSIKILLIFGGTIATYLIFVTCFPYLEKELNRYLYSLNTILTITVISMAYLCVRNVISRRI